MAASEVIGNRGQHSPSTDPAAYGRWERRPFCGPTRGSVKCPFVRTLPSNSISLQAGHQGLMPWHLRSWGGGGWTCLIWNRETADTP